MLKYTILFVVFVVIGFEQTILAQHFSHDVIRYADCMLEYGRDTYGKQTPVFVSILSRTAKPFRLHEGNINAGSQVSNKKMPGWERRYYNRDWGGSNLGNHIQLHMLLAELTRATGDPKYLKASDDAIRYVFENTQSAQTGLIVWGEHLSWNVANEMPYNGLKPVGQPHDDTHEPCDRVPPSLWDRFLSQAPDQTLRFIEGLWEHQIADKQTGMFSRHTRYTRHEPSRYAANFPRVGGWMILAWAKGYAYSSDEQYRQKMLHAISVITNLYQTSRSDVTGVIPAGIKTPGVDDPKKDFSRVYWLQNNLYFACELELAIPMLPVQWVAPLRTLHKLVDENAVLKLEHNLDGHLADAPHAFLQRGRPDLPLLANGTMQLGDGRMIEKLTRDDCYTSDWAHGYGSPLTSEIAVLMLERFAANGDQRMLTLARQAADRYMQIEPPTEKTAPFAVSSAIDLMMQIYHVTGESKYLQRAEYFGQLAESMFLVDSPLPKATTLNNHYEAITGGDDLMLTLWQLSELLNRSR